MHHFEKRGLLAVVDVETTGLSRKHDRVVELAAVVMDGDGEIVSEFESLINPDRDVGPTNIHGLSAEDVKDAPRFADVAGLFVQNLMGVVALAGHNVRFDLGFLDAEFLRIGTSLPKCPTICTMKYMGRRRLCECCQEFGIPLDEEAHRALGDARATARLLSIFLANDGRERYRVRALSPVEWPSLPVTGILPFTRRDACRIKREPPTYIERLLGIARRNPRRRCANDSDAVAAYMDLLDRFLEDRSISDQEAVVLLDWVQSCGLSAEEVEWAHRSYLTELVEIALEDGIVTNAERHDLLTVARLLGRPEEELFQILLQVRNQACAHGRTANRCRTVQDSLVGKSVCFTGELRCRYQGMPISRSFAESLAASAGLKVQQSVTKRLDLLVLADAHSQSGKARKAREYGIRIMHEAVFWRAIGLPVE